MDQTSTIIQTPLVKAWRVEKRKLPAVTTDSQKQGIRFENNVGKRLDKIAIATGGRCEHNPWFAYYDIDGIVRFCSPDYVLSIGYCDLIVECKLTFTFDAMQQLQTYYNVLTNTQPLVPRRMVRTVIVCKSMIPEAKDIAKVDRLSQLFTQNPFPSPILHWLGRTDIQW